MDLLGDSPALSLNDESWRIYSRPTAHAPQHIGSSAKVVNSIVTEGSDIYGTVRNSVIGAGVVIEEGAVVEDAVIMSETVIKAGAKVSYAIIDSGVTVGAGATVGRPKDWAKNGIAVIGAGYSVPEGGDVADGQMIS